MRDHTTIKQIEVMNLSMNEWGVHEKSWREETEGGSEIFNFKKDKIFLKVNSLSAF